MMSTNIVARSTYLLLLIFVAITSTYGSLDQSQRRQKTYVVHMEKNKIEELDRSLGNNKRWYEEILDSVYYSSFSLHDTADTYIDPGEQEAQELPQLLYVYGTVISGFAAKLSAEQVESLKKIDGFLSATPDDILSLHTTHSPQFLGLQNGKGLWDAPNLASDVIVGIIDTGIWPEHISFSDTNHMSPVPSRWRGHCEKGTDFLISNCNKKLIGARAFSKGYEAAAGKINETKDHLSARDTEGHGTHTASTVAGNVIKDASMFGMAKGTAGGMRYTARIAAYKACWSAGCASSDILAAMDQAVADGVDILSLSLGGLSRPYHSDNMAIAALGAIQNGVFVSCSAGNSGPFMSTVTNTAPWIMTVGASYLDRTFPTTVKLGNGEVFEGASLYHGKRSMTKPLSLVYGKKAGNNNRSSMFCVNGSLTPKLVKGKMVLCERGLNGRAEKGEEVKNAGGAGMLLLNTENEGEEVLADAHVLPATSLGVTAAPIMAAFSSRGPSFVGPDVIKPDVTAPGMNILAAWPPTVGPTGLKSDKRSVSFNIISGTSMSCPHVSGLAALLKSVHPDWSPAAIKSALMTTTYTINNQRKPISDAKTLNTSEPATPFAFGSGHVDPERASDPGVIYDITISDYLNYLCTLNYTSSQIALLARRTYNCPSSEPIQSPGDLNYPSFALNFYSSALNVTVTYKRTVTNVGKPTSRYMVHVSQPDGVMIIVEPKVLKFRNLGQKLSYKVHFMTLGRKPANRTSFSFGSLIWMSEKYSVQSPIAVTWL